MKKSYGLIVAMVVLFLANYSNAQWSDAQLPGTGTGNNVTALATDGRYIYAAINPGGGIPAVFRYDGVSWSATDQIDLPAIAQVISLFDVNANLLAGSSYWGIYYSNDSGVTWTWKGFTNLSVNSFAFDGTNFYAGGSDASGNGVVYISTDNGQSWTSMTSPISGNYKVGALVWANNRLYAGLNGPGGGGVYSYYSGSWHDVNNSPMTNTTLVYSMTYDGTRLYAGTGGGHVLSSGNYGNNWTDNYTGSPNGIGSLCVTSNLSFVLAGNLIDGFYSTSDKGSTWAQNNTGLTDNTQLHSVLSVGNTVYAGTGDGYVATGTIGDLSLPVQVASYKAVAADNGVELSWVTQSEVNNAGFDVLRQDPGTGVFAVIGSYLSNDSLRGLGTSTTGKAYSFTDTKVSKGTTYVYLLQSVSTSGVKENFGSLVVTMRLPEVYSLSQNYPNPFNPSTKIKIDLKQSSDLTLTIYNVLGQVVEQLNYGTMNAGSYPEELNMGRFSSGVYFYRIEAVGSNGEHFAATKKMVLMK